MLTSVAAAITPRKSARLQRTADASEDTAATPPDETSPNDDEEQQTSAGNSSGTTNDQSANSNGEDTATVEGYGTPHSSDTDERLTAAPDASRPNDADTQNNARNNEPNDPSSSDSSSESSDSSSDDESSDDEDAENTGSRSNRRSAKRRRNKKARRRHRKRKKAKRRRTEATHEVAMNESIRRMKLASMLTQRDELKDYGDGAGSRFSGDRPEGMVKLHESIEEHSSEQEQLQSLLKFTDAAGTTKQLTTPGAIKKKDLTELNRLAELAWNSPTANKSTFGTSPYYRYHLRKLITNCITPELAQRVINSIDASTTYSRAVKEHDGVIFYAELILHVEPYVFTYLEGVRKEIRDLKIADHKHNPSAYANAALPKFKILSAHKKPYNEGLTFIFEQVTSTGCDAYNKKMLEWRDEWQEDPESPNWNAQRALSIALQEYRKLLLTGQFKDDPGLTEVMTLKAEVAQSGNQTKELIDIIKAQQKMLANHEQLLKSYLGNPSDTAQLTRKGDGNKRFPEPDFLHQEPIDKNETKTFNHRTWYWCADCNKWVTHKQHDPNFKSKREERRNNHKKTRFNSDSKAIVAKLVRIEETL
mmetsp:Transcript_30556/g.61928  ORF Transcript_30556/g.61928 Transcript_30556/m.61928 type:complete len:590 (-) Transcript_30556:113-1882(-)|eukprot:CAMPEP_0178578520 /NCGR_PEP_ID=MMETSP0697-20121206/21592_1 /TAXON_ID=265572 /ORGANISM="Extubocellulus spinifer, Strain CCMP396" /LENGTH=589 /DNA_ID=CAMNT_0020213905 /DNA_START=44 /DNA_END=1813 /DNA_ORIENTATION=+